MIKRVSATAPTNDLDVDGLLKLAKRLEIGREQLAKVLGVDPSTVWRWEHQGVAPTGAVRVRFVQLGELNQMLRRLFDGPDLAREWIHHAKPEFFGGNTTPLTVMLEGRIDRVLMLLNMLAAGG